MSEKIVQLNEEVIKGQIKELVRGSVEETLNELLEAEAERLTQAARYERSEARQGYRSGHYDRNLPPPPGMSRSTCPVTRASPSRLPSSSVTAAGKAAWRKPSLRCIWPECLCVEWKISRNAAKMLKAIHAQESKKASREKSMAVVAELKSISSRKRQRE